VNAPKAIIEEACTIFLIAAGDRRLEARELTQVHAREVVRGSVWIADQPQFAGVPPSALAGVVVVAGDVLAVRDALTEFDVQETPAIARAYRSEGPSSSSCEGASLIAAMRPAAGLSRKEAMRAWQAHVPLALDVHLGARRYVQYEMLSDAMPFFGMVDLHFESRAAVDSGLFRTPEDAHRVNQDAARFSGGTDMFIGSQYAMPAA